MSTARHHAEWLSLVESSGPFLSMPVLLRVFPQGLEQRDAAKASGLREAYEDWLERGDKMPAIHQAWIRHVLEKLLEYPPEFLVEGQGIPPGMEAVILNYGETLRPDFALKNREPGQKPLILIKQYPPEQDLEKPVAGQHWKASPGTRMMELLHAADVPLGLVTNGEQWMLVYAPRGETTGFASWYSDLWMQEPLTLRAFHSLLHLRRFLGVAEPDTLAGLYAASSKDQQEVTDQLGYQVRQAVEMLVQAFDRIDAESGRTLLEDVSEKTIYDSALTVMMRLVFLFSAEERGLLLLGDPLYDQHYAVSTLSELLRERADQHGEEILGHRHDAWCRLLATFRAVHAGVEHEAMRLPPHGGTLFDPDRYPFLEGRPGGTRWQAAPAAPLPINNRVVLHLLEALQMLRVKVPGAGPAEARRVSFRALDIEQIGHVYEGLLDHTAKRATEPMLGLKGAKNREPELPLSDLEELLGVPTQGASEITSHEFQPDEISLAAETPVNLVPFPEPDKSRGYDIPKKFIKFLTVETGRSASALKKAITQRPDDDGHRLLLSCGSDCRLSDRIARFAGLIREDTFGMPVVIQGGSLYVTKGSDRRSSGTHYTPRSLTEPIVEHTLEPLVYIGPAEGKPKKEWQLKTPREILALKVCDMAMGSGAFVVQTCRYLGERLVEAWENAEKINPGRFLATPEGDFSEGDPKERLIPADPAERLAIARRYVADRCLYGVDINPMAVEMAKLSLWLITLQRDRPFTFLDHALKCGDSLLGISSVTQIDNFSLCAKTGEVVEHSFATVNLFRYVEAASTKRRELEDLPSNDHTQIETKTRLHAEAEAATSKVKAIADCLIAFELRGLDGNAYAEQRAEEAEKVQLLMKRDAEAGIETSNPKSELTRATHESLRGRRPFHWSLEFPEVFARGGFDAFVGNPPFMGGQKITGELGTDYRNYLVKQLVAGKRGIADFCAYFFVRAHSLLNPAHGMAGLVATNTIAQGDSREVGLEQIVAAGSVIPRAVPSRPWPGVAALEVAYVWLRRGTWAGESTLRDKVVSGITPFLTEPGLASGKPFRLAANAAKSFIGSYVLGMGFVLTTEIAHALIARDERNREVLFPYLNGEDLNSRPDQSPSRWVINFHDWPLDRSATGKWLEADESAREDWIRAGRVPSDYPHAVADDYPECLEIIERLVKPQRLAQSDEIGQRRWWRYLRTRPELYEKIREEERTLIRARIANMHSMFMAPRGWVYNEKVVVFPAGSFPLLQSNIHEVWAREYSSTLKADMQYTPSDCCETFPFLANIHDFDSIGERYHEFRRQVMLSQCEGLTKTYNRFHNRREQSEDIARVRALHKEMDQAVAAAYGWSDLDLGHGFHPTKQGERYTLSETARRTVLDRLLALNHERYDVELKAGLHEKRAKKAKPARKPKAASPTREIQELGLDFGPAIVVTPKLEPALAALPLIPYLLSEAARMKVTLRMTELKQTFDFLTNPGLMLEAAATKDKAAVKVWAGKWNSPVGQEWFIRALRQLAGSTVRAITEDDDPPMALVVAPTQPDSPELKEGIRLALRVVRSTPAMQPDERAEVIRERRSIFTTV